MCALEECGLRSAILPLNMMSIYFLLALPFRSQPLDIPIEPADDVCLHCICTALSNCNNQGCSTSNGIDYCGPFYLHHTYWRETGEQGGDFNWCVRNLTCAKETVSTYMELYARDCNSNGVVECGDYYRIHRRGKIYCDETGIEDDEQWLNFLECYLNRVDNPRSRLRMFARNF